MILSKFYSIAATIRRKGSFGLVLAVTIFLIGAKSRGWECTLLLAGASMHHERILLLLTLPWTESLCFYTTFAV